MAIRTCNGSICTRCPSNTPATPRTSPAAAASAGSSSSSSPSPSPADGQLDRPDAPSAGAGGRCCCSSDTSPYGSTANSFIFSGEQFSAAGRPIWMIWTARFRRVGVCMSGSYPGPFLSSPSLALCGADVYIHGSFRVVVECNDLGVTCNASRSGWSLRVKCQRNEIWR